MSSIKTGQTYTPGASVWQELTAVSAEGLAEFYQQVLGWELAVDGSQGVFTLEGTPVAGLRIDPAVPPAESGWRVFLGTDDLSATLDRATAAGAMVLEQETALPVDSGSAVVLRDPEGSIFGLASVVAERASVPASDVGRLALVDVMSHDVSAARTFHTALFPDNRLEHVEEQLSLYRDDLGQPLRGINAVDDELKTVLPPHWLAWFVVADQARAAETAQAAGGDVNTQDQPIAFGRWAVVTDPSGAAFKALQLDRPI